MKEQGYPRQLIKVVKNLYEETKIVLNFRTEKSEEILTNKGVRQVCPMSPTLFNIYINNIIQNWKQKIDAGIKITRGKILNILLYADDVVLIQETEDDLQRSIHHLHQICQNYNIEISKEKTKVMANWGKIPIRSKIVVDDKIIEQVSSFNYLGCEISTEKDKDTEKKLTRFQMICGTIHNTLKNKTRPDTRMKFYNTMAIPTLLYGCESWVPTQRTTNRIQSCEMKFLRKTKGCTREDRIRNEEIRKELEAEAVNSRMDRYRKRWLQHVGRMEDTRLPKLAFQYAPKGKRDVGRPRTRWKETL